MNCTYDTCLRRTQLMLDSIDVPEFNFIPKLRRSRTYLADSMFSTLCKVTCEMWDLSLSERYWPDRCCNWPFKIFLLFTFGSVKNGLLEQYVFISTIIKVFKIQSCNRQTDGQCININKVQVFIFLGTRGWSQLTTIIYRNIHRYLRNVKHILNVNMNFPRQRSLYGIKQGREVIEFSPLTAGQFYAFSYNVPSINRFADTTRCPPDEPFYCL